MEDIVIFPSRKKLVLMAVGAFVFIAIGVFIIRKPETFWIVRVLGGYLGVAFFGICLGYAIFRLIKPKPSLVINDEGVFDNASAVGAGMSVDLESVENVYRLLGAIWLWFMYRYWVYVRELIVAEKREFTDTVNDLASARFCVLELRCSVIGDICSNLLRLSS